MTQKCTFKKYIGVIIKCPKCGDRGYLELWATEPPYMPVFRVCHKKGLRHGKCHSITIKVCWLTNEQAEQLYRQHTEKEVTHTISVIEKKAHCYICNIYLNHGMVTPHGASLQ